MPVHITLGINGPRRNAFRRAELIRQLQAAGGDIVLVDEPGAAAKAAALDGVSGAATARLVEFPSPGGTLVAYAGMSGEKTAPGDLMQLMFKSISSHFFYQNRPQYRGKIPALLREAAQMVTTGRLHAPVSRIYRLSEVAEAIARTLAGGKVLLDVAEHGAGQVLR